MPTRLHRRLPATVPLLAAALVLVAARAEPANVGPWRRTESRDPCARFDVLRAPYFGDLHVHTTYSFDAVSGDVRTGPRDAYRFAQGEPIDLPPYDADGHALRSVRLGRPLDFTAVTDHAEFFGEVHVCLVPGDPGYDSDECVAYRTAIPQLTQSTSPGIGLFAITYLTGLMPMRFGFCGPGAADCLREASVVWQDTQSAAEQFYDRTTACGFTTFVAYEWTGNTGVQNLHRNVIFRNATVPPLPISYVEQPTPRGLWDALHTQCLDGLPGCDALAIPHNSNLSNGAMFVPESGAADAAFRAAMEPLVEVTQHKGDSECRLGVLTNDELCGFEKWSGSQIGIAPAPNQVYPPLSFVRNALKEGLVQEERLGVNPFRLGLVGGTDTHNSTPGATREDDWQGHLGTRDATAPLMLAPIAFGVVGGAESNPGGLAVAWAEENSRDALFAAMRRREVYATSGTRPIVRFFAGALGDETCDAADFVERGYRDGTPMGGEIGPVRGTRSPRFAVLAMQDAGEPGVPGTPLERVQIVKGWVDAGGHAQEHVFDGAGGATGAAVDPATCATSGSGFPSLCTVWTDPEFDRSQRAFYYARVVENPVCRWSTRLCNAAGVDCTAGAPSGLAACCDPKVPRTVQERAWTSPIWYRPEGVARLAARVRYGRRPGTDVLRLAARIGRLPAGFDAATQPISLALRDDDDVFTVTIPPGALRPDGHGLVLAHDLAGVARLRLSTRRDGEAILRLQTARTDLGSADRVDHALVFELHAGLYQVTHTRLWHLTRNRLATRS